MKLIEKIKLENEDLNAISKVMDVLMKLQDMMNATDHPFLENDTECFSFEEIVDTFDVLERLFDVGENEMYS